MIRLLDKYRLFLVDMDNTLYDERDFVRSGFRAVAGHVAAWGLAAAAAGDYLQRRFDACGREKIFDHLLREFGLEVTPERITELVEVYRGHKPQIALFPGAEEVLRYMRERGRVVVVTDGLPAVQERKFKALGLERLVDQVVYCWATGFPKPDPRSLEGIVRQGDPEAVMIGDREDHDMEMARRWGVDGVKVGGSGAVSWL
ncbi:MAG: HAD family hydrolase [Trichloromonas sp.]|jgi:putative hydrolase of the HAD superfamily|nr:HAD family hydrolase [Trichloromonas sp.]